VLKIHTYAEDFGQRAMDSEQKPSSCKREWVDTKCTWIMMPWA